MATVFGASLSPMEREAQLIFMECEMTSSKIEAIQDITNAQYDRAIMAAEYTVLKTGGTYDDLDRLMMEAAAQQGEKKVGIIRTILNSIGSAISSIGNWIQRNLGANNDRLNGLPANAQGDVDGYDLKAANEGLTGLPKVFNKLKEIIKSINACIQGNKEFAVASVAVAAVAAVLVKGSKEEQEAKEEPITQVNKETAQDMLNRYLKLQGTANELTGEVDTLLKKLGLPMKALKAKAEDIAAKKNQKRAEKDAQASDNGGGEQQQQQAQPETASAPIDHVAGDNMMESTDSYGLGAYDELFMESKRKNQNNKNQQGNQTTNNTKTGTGTTNAQTGNQQNQQGNQTKKTGTTNGQSGQASAAGSTSGSTSGQANTGTANAQTGNQQNQQSSGTGSTSTAGSTGGQSSQPKEEPKKDTQQAQASGSTGEQKTDATANANAQGNNGDNAQAETESEFSKLPWYDKAITVLQATLETMLALVAATGKSVLNIVAKVIQWDKIKAGANKLEQRVMDGRGNGKDDNANQSNEGNDQQQTADNGGNGGGDANADNGSEAAHDDTVTGDYTTESPDLFGIHDEYNEMMESPSMEELNSFEAIFDNL